MNFFESQARARSQTTTLVVLFALAVLSLIALTNLLFMVFLGYLGLEDQALNVNYILHQFNWRIFASISAVVFVFILVASLYKISSLSGGGKVVATSLGGTLVAHANDNLQYKILLNVVEEMAIASGTPVPPVYVMKKEQGINAFAAGFTVDDAVIGVTQGALDCFTREELQGVIAHEFSHIIHGDMRLNIKLTGLLHGILLIGLVGYYIMHMSGGNSRSEKGNQLVFLGIGLVVIGYGGTFFGNAIKASVSRQREYLADASAVQYTRNNQGIANALKKIGGFSAGSKLNTTEAQSMSHAFFSNALTNKFSSLFSTHPPLPKRIKALDTNWKGTFDRTQALSDAQLRSSAAGISHMAPPNAQSSTLQNSKTSLEFTQSVGVLEQSQIDLAKSYIAQMPAPLLDAVHTTTGAQAYVYALLLSESSQQNVNHEVTQQQLEYLQAHLPNNIYIKTSEILPQVNELSFEHRLPLLEIALPQLRQIHSLRYEAMLQQMQYLVFADNHLTLFEWSIANIVAAYLKTEFESADKRHVKYRKVAPIQHHLETILSVIMNEFCDAGEHQHILAKSNAILGTKNLVIKASSEDAVEQFANAINTLQYLSFDLKEKVLQLCIYAVTQDKIYTPREHETIRALAECLGCPLPIANVGSVSLT